MESLTEYILNAFYAQWPRLAADPLELAARLQRRHHALLQSPPRDWCIALRANDTRLTPMFTIMDDCHAPAQRRPHQITIDATLVRRLVAPVEVHWMGQTPHEIAAMLGVGVRNLRNAVDRGVFTRRRIQGLGGKPGKPQPLLACPHPLDPAGPLYRPPGGYWGHSWKHRADNFPGDHEQIIERRPHFRPIRQCDIIDDWADDDLCAVNSSAVDPARDDAPHADPPHTDPSAVAATPALPTNIDRQPSGDAGVAATKSLPPRSAAAAEVANTAPTTAPLTSGRFHDWHWTCPACRHGVRKLYFPLPVPNVETYLNLPLAPPGQRLHEADAPPTPLPTFACEDCHHLTHIDERSYKGWNAVVTYFTCGLLYGHEIPRPEEWPYEMPATYRKRRTAAP